MHASVKLTHLCLASRKRDIGKQCRPKSDAAEYSIWPGSTLFALNTGISLKYGNNKNYTDSPSIENGPIWWVVVESPFGINGLRRSVSWCSDSQRYLYTRARENRKNSQSGPKLRILDRFQTPQNANKSVQQVCALNPIFPQPTNFHESMMSKKSQTVKSSQTDNVHVPFKCDIMVVERL